MLDDEGVPVMGLRPTGLVEPLGPQERLQRHTVEHRILEALVPHMVDKLEDELKIVDLFVPVQEIEVPQISSLVLPEPQSA